MEHPQIIQELIEDFKKLPSIGRKTATRLAYSLLHFSSQDIDKFSNDIKQIQTKIKKCNICHNLYEGTSCPICSDSTRDKTTLMVISDNKNIMQFENTNQYYGQYFCLNGLINPAIGNLPNTVGIDSLLEYIKSNNFVEIIYAFSPDITGEITTSYISKLLKQNNINIKQTRLAYGIPVNSQLEYLDEDTLSSSLRSRITIPNTTYYESNKIASNNQQVETNDYTEDDENEF